MTATGTCTRSFRKKARVQKREKGYTYIVQFVVEATGIANWLAIVVAAPEGGGGGLAVGAGGASSTSRRLLLCFGNGSGGGSGNDGKDGNGGGDDQQFKDGQVVIRREMAPS